jgi:hypothetical protein
VTRLEAHELLNAAQTGQDVSQILITLALMATGDIEEASVPVVLLTPVGDWESKNKGLAPAEWFEVIA